MHTKSQSKVRSSDVGLSRLSNYVWRVLRGHARGEVVQRPLYFQVSIPQMYLKRFHRGEVFFL